MCLKIVKPEDFCEEFGEWDSCKDCQYSVERYDNKLQCPKLSFIKYCECCPFGSDGEYSEFCSPHPDASHPCEYDDYKEMYLPDVIRCLHKREASYARYLDKQELEAERKFYVNEERAEDTKKVKRANSLINTEIRLLRSKVNKLRKAEQELKSRYNATIATNKIFNGSNSNITYEPFKSPFEDTINNAISRISVLAKERSENTKRVKKEIETSKLDKLNPQIENCLAEIASDGIPRIYEVLALTIDGKFVGVSCKVSKVLYLAIAKLASSKVSKKALREQYTCVDFTLDGCNKELVEKFNGKLNNFYTQDLILFKNEYVSREEKRLGIRNMEINDTITRNMLLQSIIKFS